MQAALAAGRYIPHLCYHPEFTPHGSCKVCTVKVNGRMMAACTTPAEARRPRSRATPRRLNELRRTLVQMLFAEGNHFCPSCEKSGDCVLQALGYDLGRDDRRIPAPVPGPPVDASHPDILLDFNRCILCELCVRAAREVDGKHVFALSGRGIDQAPDRQCRVGPARRYRRRRHRQGRRGLPGRRDPAQAASASRADRRAPLRPPPISAQALDDAPRPLEPAP